MTIHVFPCKSCQFEIPVEPKPTEQQINCPRCGHQHERIFLSVTVKGVEPE